MGELQGATWSPGGGSPGMVWGVERSLWEGPALCSVSPLGPQSPSRPQQVLRPWPRPLRPAGSGGSGLSGPLEPRGASS